MVPLSPYFRLMRLHQPVGIWLLLWPCWWSVALATYDYPSLKLLLLFGIGAVLMRSAGCIINDMADREFDKQVERTKTRPLASGELGMTQAAAALLLLLTLALAVALMLGFQAVLWGVLALLPVAIYPFMKRISWWPQLFLGLTFNWGALMGWAVVRGQVEWPAIALYAGGVFWTLGYDTIYAHQDKTDDAKIGVKSTARRLGKHTRSAVAVFYTLAWLCWLAAGNLALMHDSYYLLMIPALSHLLWQVYRLDIHNPLCCRKIFVSNTWLGLWVMIACLFGRFSL